MVWGAAPYGSLPTAGATEVANAHPAVGAAAHFAAYHLFGVHPQVTPTTHLGVVAFSASAVAVDAVTVTYTVTPSLTGTVIVTVTGPGDPVVLGYVVQLDGSYLVTVLGMIPLQPYTIEASNGFYTVPADYTALPGDVQTGYRILEAVTYACGKQVQDLSGVPACQMVTNFDVFDTVMYVTSTLGFPPAGYLRVSGLLLEYMSKTSQSFTFPAPVLRYPLIPQGTTVFLASDWVTPDGAGFGAGGD
jgi:hypothetical protein